MDVVFIERSKEQCSNAEWGRKLPLMDMLLKVSWMFNGQCKQKIFTHDILHSL